VEVEVLVHVCSISNSPIYKRNKDLEYVLKNSNR